VIWAATAMLALGLAQGSESKTYVLIVSGVGGEPAYSETFYSLGAAMADAARTRYGATDSTLIFLAETPARDTKRIQGASSKTNIEQALATLGRRSHAGDVIFILFIGHGSSQEGVPRFNVPGPDISAPDMARLLDPLAGRKVAFVAATSASGEFAAALSGPDRTIVTATKSGMERNESQFAKYLVEAYKGEGADTDKDGRVSLLEAYEYARREVARSYEQASKLQTEHSQLDDNGDKVATAAPDAHTPDGALAKRIFLGRAQVTAAAASSSDPRVAGLLHEKDSIEARIDALRRAKAQMDSVAYEKQLESLLVSLATKNQAIRAVGGGKP
jgi:hypothetical protein